MAAGLALLGCETGGREVAALRLIAGAAGRKRSGWTAFACDPRAHYPTIGYCEGMNCQEVRALSHANFESSFDTPERGTTWELPPVLIHVFRSFALNRCGYCCDLRFSTFWSGNNVGS